MYIKKYLFARGPSLWAQHTSSVRSARFTTNMAPTVFLLVSFVACLHSTHGLPPWLNDLMERKIGLPAAEEDDSPQTIDQVLMKASGGQNPVITARFGEDMVTDGLDTVMTKRQYDGLLGKTRGRAHEKGPFVTPWTDGVIPYEIVRGHFNERQRNKIRQAMRNWEAVTCLTFREAGNKEKNKIQITNVPGCWAILGMSLSGPQKMTLGDKCFWKGTVEHEIGHAIGLVHEHQRPERDDFLRVNLGNVQSAMRDSLEKYNEGAVDKMGVPYDYYSVMHYSSTAFSYDFESETMYAYNKTTGEKLPEITEDLAKTQGPSFYDAKLVNIMYNCSAKCSSKPKCGSDCFVDQHCKCVCKGDLSPLPCEDLQRDCQSVKQKGECYFPEIMEGTDYYCKKTCGWCNKGNSRLPPAEIDLPDGPCFDKESKSKCEMWFDMNQCEDNPKYMHKNCMKTCDRCPGGGGNRPQTTKSPQKDEPCEDKNNACKDWASRGECQKNPNYMLPNCKKSCNQCGNGGNSKPKPKPDSSGSCKDNNAGCPDWARRGECEKNPNWMLPNCKLSCNKCGNGGGSSRPNNSGCKDTHKLCSSWARQNYCNQSAVRKVCKKTCGVC